MEYDYLTIGQTPAFEPCAQVGSENYYEKAKKEMIAYKNQIERQNSWLTLNTDIYIGIKWFNHDFGRYGEVVVYYNVHNNAAFKTAIELEENLPEYWDSLAMKELGLNEYASKDLA